MVSYTIISDADLIDKKIKHYLCLEPKVLPML